MDTIRKETAAVISRTRYDMMFLQKQIMKTQEKLKNLEAAIKNVELNANQSKKTIRRDDAA